MKRAFIQLGGCPALLGAAVPVSWASLPVRYGKDDYTGFIRTKDDVEGKPAKDRATEIGIEDWKSPWRNGDEVNQAVQFIKKPKCGADAPLGIPGDGFFGVL